jgi:hypothetical protein
MRDLRERLRVGEALRRAAVGQEGLVGALAGAHPEGRADVAMEGAVRMDVPEDADAVRGERAVGHSPAGPPRVAASPRR